MLFVSSTSAPFEIGEHRGTGKSWLRWQSAAIKNGWWAKRRALSFFEQSLEWSRGTCITSCWGHSHQSDGHPQVRLALSPSPHSFPAPLTARWPAETWKRNRSSFGKWGHVPRGQGREMLGGNWILQGGEGRDLGANCWISVGLSFSVKWEGW